MEDPPKKKKQKQGKLEKKKCGQKTKVSYQQKP